MNAAEPADLREFEPQWLDELVPMWRESFEFGVGIVDPHPLAGQRQFFLDQVLPRNTVRLAFAGSRLAGFVAATKDSVAQLHVRVGLRRRGIGTLLLDWAKRRSDGSLWLYTFARNHGAQAFYERHGFRVVARGFEPSWQLDDIKYAWSARASDANSAGT